MSKSRYHGAGYLLVDNSASDWGTKEESDLLVCGMCDCTIRVQDWVDHLGRFHEGHRANGAFCHRCDKPLCGSGANNCAARPPCSPGHCPSFIMTLEEKINDYYRRQQNARILGI
jgi:hypothetical protein